MDAVGVWQPTFTGLLMNLGSGVEFHLKGKVVCFFSVPPPVPFAILFYFNFLKEIYFPTCNC